MQENMPWKTEEEGSHCKQYMGENLEGKQGKGKICMTKAKIYAPSAAAEVSVEVLLHLVRGRRRVRVEQGRHVDHPPGGAIPALAAVAVGNRPLHFAEPRGFGAQPFYGGDGQAVARAQEPQARVNGHGCGGVCPNGFYGDRARAAPTFPAANLHFFSIE